MGMLVVTALVTFFVQRQELWSIGKKAAVKMDRDGSGGCAGTGTTMKRRKR